MERIIASNTWTLLVDTFNNEILAHQATPIQGSTKPYYHCLEQLKLLAGKKNEEQTPQVVLHTDQGSVYSSQAFRQAHEHYNILRSMSKVGTPTDNAIIEAINGWIYILMFFRFNFNNFKHIPKRNIYLSLIFLALTLYSLFCILEPQKRLLQNTQEISLRIDAIEPMGNKSRGSKQYSITAGGQSYYFVYYYSDSEVNSEYKMFRELLNNHTRNDAIIITATVSTKQTPSDVIYNRHRILRFSSGGTEYLSMRATEKHMENIYRGAWVGLVLFGVCFFVLALFNVIAYEIIKKKNL